MKFVWINSFVRSFADKEERNEETYVGRRTKYDRY